MNLSANRWYVAWFFWSCRALDNFCGGWDDRNSKYAAKGTNLCHFFRTLMWGSLIFTSVFALYIWVVFVVLVLPFILFKFASVGGALLVVTGIILGAITFLAALIGIFQGGILVTETIKTRNANLQQKEPSFLSLVIAYIVATKKKFCPTIQFKDIPDV